MEEPQGSARLRLPGGLDVGVLNCEHIHAESYKATHPDAPGHVGTGATPEAACRDLAEKAGVKYVAVLTGPYRLNRETGDVGQPEILHSGEGLTPEDAWTACNRSKANELRKQIAALEAST